MGHFRPFGSFRIPDHSIESDQRIFVYIRSKSRVQFSSRRKEIFLMNASDAARIDASIFVREIAPYTMQAYNHLVRPQGAAIEVTPNVQGLLTISEAVQRGGMLVLTPVQGEDENARVP